MGQNFTKMRRTAIVRYIYPPGDDLQKLISLLEDPKIPNLIKDKAIATMDPKLAYRAACYYYGTPWITQILRHVRKTITLGVLIHHDDRMCEYGPATVQPVMEWARRNKHSANRAEFDAAKAKAASAVTAAEAAAADAAAKARTAEASSSAAAQEAAKTAQAQAATALAAATAAQQAVDDLLLNDAQFLFDVLTLWGGGDHLLCIRHSDPDHAWMVEALEPYNPLPGEVESLADLAIEAYLANLE